MNSTHQKEEGPSEKLTEKRAVRQMKCIMYTILLILYRDSPWHVCTCGRVCVTPHSWQRRKARVSESVRVVRSIQSISRMKIDERASTASVINYRMSRGPWIPPGGNQSAYTRHNSQKTPFNLPPRWVWTFDPILDTSQRSLVTLLNANLYRTRFNFINDVLKPWRALCPKQKCRMRNWNDRRETWRIF